MRGSPWYIAGLAATLAVPVRAQAPAPTLVVMITVDQMRADYLDRFRPQFSGGLARLLREGAVFTHGYQDHAITETAPGHASVLSGRWPASTGIIRNSEGVNDSTPLLLVRGAGASPLRFRGTALYDWMKARWPEARVLSVSRKDRGAILPVGRSRGDVYWYAAGIFTTSRYYRDSLPDWVRAFNEEAVAPRRGGLAWDLLLPASAYPEPDSMPYENGGRDVAFPHVQPMDSIGATTAFVSSPMMDSVTLALALRGADVLGLGRGPGADLLAVSLSATDYIGHAWGPDSREIHDQILRLDRYLGAFLDSLCRAVPGGRIVLALTADHGVTSYPEFRNMHGDPAAKVFDATGLVRATQESLRQRAGPGNWIRYFDTGMLVIDRAGLAAKGVNVDSVVAGMAAELHRMPQVDRVDTPASLARADTARDDIARRWLHLVPPDVHPELLVTLQPHDVWGTNTSAMHGNPSEDDAHVAMVLWGAAIRAGVYPDRVGVVDIAPTLAQVLGVTPSERLDGRVLIEAVTAR